MIHDRGRGILLLALLLAQLSLPGGMAIAEAPDLHPLRPADTSSPRETLRSFLSDANEVIGAWRRGEMRAASFRAHNRAVETLDLSTTAHGDSSSVQTLRVLLLKEILDRIALPAYDQIPGAGEVVDGSLTRWTLPDTRITIARIPDGPRAGEFLFSAETVAQLDRLYRQAQSMPYKPGATAGIYEDFLRSNRSWYVSAAEVRDRLRPIDASSPLSTLEGFLDSVNRSHELVVEADGALRARPPAMSTEQALELEAKADKLLRRAVGALDLSQVAQTLRHDVGVEAALKLKEILDRIPLPPLESVPDAGQVEARRDSGNPGPLRWRLPNTEIEIVEITDGDRAGDFLFSAGTVARLGKYYEELRDLPYREDDHAALAGEYLSSGRSEGFYVGYVSTPGYLVPRAHLLGNLLDDLPDLLLELHASNTTWQWLSLVFCGLAVALAASLVFRVVQRVRSRTSPPWEQWLALLTPAAAALLLVGAVGFIDNDVNLTGRPLVVVTTGAQALVLAMATWAVFILCRALAETLIASPRIPEQSIDASLIRIAARVFAFLIAAWIVVDGARGLGADVIPLLAGLGVGGLAVALAAQTTLANFIGSLILFATKPVRVGDFCRYGDEIGTVEHIGLHATHIRTLERSVVTVPNAEFSQMKLDNFSRRDLRLFTSVLQLRYETTPEQLRWVLAKLRGLLLGHPEVTPDPARVRFVGFGPYSKNLEIFAYLRCRDHDIFLAIQEDLLLRIDGIVAAAGTGFAFPSQTSYLAHDSGLDAERSREAEAQVGRWRAQDRLPFPEFAAEERHQQSDVLDYPPEGSPDHRPRRSRRSDVPD
jgi:MscS family membrane protein